MPKCNLCDADVSTDALYCQSCGARLSRLADDSSAKSPLDLSSADAQAETSAEKISDNLGSRRQNKDELELDVWQGGYSPKAMVGTAAFGAIVCVAVLIGAISIGGPIIWWACGITVVLILGYLGACLLYRKLNVRFRLTTQRFFHESGILRRVTDRIEVIDMDDITFEQGLLERFLGVGTIHITSSDRTHPALVLVGIDNVKDVAAKIDQARRDERVRRGLHIEVI